MKQTTQQCPVEQRVKKTDYSVIIVARSAKEDGHSSRLPHLLRTMIKFPPGEVITAASMISCDEEKILWTLVFFKDGRTARWSKNLFRQEVDTSIFPIQSWTYFEQQFRSQFFPVNAEADTVNALEGSSYYQGNRTVDNYLDTFLTLVSDAEYTDPWTLVVKFRQGLKLSIQSQITTMPFGRPTDTDLEAWYVAAWRIDQARLTNEAFQSTLRSTTTTPARSAPSRSASLLTFCLPLSMPPPVPPRPAPPAPSEGILMNIDAVRKARSLPL